VNRAYNFNAGPSALPLTVLEKAQEELLDFKGTGMSVMEHSHRGKAYEAVHNEAISLIKELIGVGDDYQVLFLQGGASLQFSMIPMNFLPQGKKAAYVMTGVWAEKAYEEAEKAGAVYEAASTKDSNYNRIPRFDELKYNKDDAYLHITSNNTIFGTQWQDFPDTGGVPIVADMSSDILCKPIKGIEKFGMIYAGAQKNLGPSGVTVVIAKNDFLNNAVSDSKMPTMLKYSTHVKNNSLYNTPPTFGIYLMALVLAEVKKLGGAEGMYKKNAEKAALIYDAIDKSGGFYKGHAEVDSRSLMNITFRLANEEIEKQFLKEAGTAGFVGLAGHRLVGGLRASAYNAVPYEACKALKDFMCDFANKNG
jgi:phosphoserine aminotransferase